MINTVTIMGRITNDLELYQAGNTVTLNFTVAVDRDYVKQGEDRQTDFLRCTAWGKTAEFVQKYFAKGKMIAASGNLRSGSYKSKGGETHYTTEIYVEKVSFTGEKAVQQSQQAAQPVQQPQQAQPTTILFAPPDPETMEQQSIPIDFNYSFSDGVEF